MANKESINKTVYFYAVDPGALAIMSPLVDASPNAINCLWVAEGYAKQKLNSKGINTVELDELLNKKARNLHKGAVIVLGSQHNFGRTVDTLKVCSALGIKTIFVFDHWCNYGRHFASRDGSMMIPTRILVMDDYVKSELVSLGINKTRIATIGHPGIEYAIESAKSIDSESKKKLQKKLGLKPEIKVVLLALELMSHNFNAELEYGPVLTVIEALKTINCKEVHIVVRLHPQQSRSKYLDFLEYHQLKENVILCQEGISTAESLAIADIVIGMNSVFLLSSLTLGIPTISLRLNPKNYDRNIEIIPYLKKIMVDNPSQLCESISEKLNQRSIEEVPIPMGSVRRAWDEIRRLV